MMSTGILRLTLLGAIGLVAIALAADDFTWQTLPDDAPHNETRKRCRDCELSNSVVAFAILKVIVSFVDIKMTDTHEVYKKTCDKLEGEECLNCAKKSVANCTEKFDLWIKGGELTPACNGACKGYLVDDTICSKVYNQAAKFTKD